MSSSSSSGSTWRSWYTAADGRLSLSHAFAPGEVERAVCGVKPKGELVETEAGNPRCTNCLVRRGRTKKEGETAAKMREEAKVTYNPRWQYRDWEAGRGGK